MRKVFKIRVAASLEPERVLCGIDSRVILGCWLQGRSSSTWLNRLLQGTIGWCILGRTALLPFWVPSAENFGDDPSRDRQLPPPEAFDVEQSALARPEWPPPRLCKSGLSGAECIGLENVFRAAAAYRRPLPGLGCSWTFRLTPLWKDDITDITTCLMTRCSGAYLISAARGVICASTSDYLAHPGRPEHGGPGGSRGTARGIPKKKGTNSPVGPPCSGSPRSGPDVIDRKPGVLVCLGVWADA